MSYPDDPTTEEEHPVFTWKVVLALAGIALVAVLVGDRLQAEPPPTSMTTAQREICRQDNRPVETCIEWYIEDLKVRSSDD